MVLRKSEIIKLHSLFDTIKLFVWEACGDGDGWIIAENYKELADIFETYEQKDGLFINRHDCEEVILFGHGQESIYFVSENYELPSWAGDIVVRSSHFCDCAAKGSVHKENK